MSAVNCELVHRMFPVCGSRQLLSTTKCELSISYAMGQVPVIGTVFCQMMFPLWSTATTEVLVQTKIIPSKAVMYGCIPVMLVFHSMFDVSGAGPVENLEKEESP